jgi:hypothetical protein
LNVNRVGRDDSSYRIIIKLKAAVNTGAGVPELLIAIIQGLYSATYAHYTLNSPGAAEIKHDGVSSLFIYSQAVMLTGNAFILANGNRLRFAKPDETLVDMIQTAVPAGVRLTVTKE